MNDRASPAHWTYCGVKPGDDLAQGDIISRSDALNDWIKQSHAHFCDKKYLAFLIATQTCDLVKRNGRCKSHHVSLAVIRSLTDVMPRFLEELCGTEIPGVYEKERKHLAKQLLERILNQNEQALGIFYLYPDLDAGIAAESVALLRVTIPFCANQYEQLQKARVGRLDPLFSSKLGWLLGNIYARVPTPDWSECEGGKQTYDSLIKDWLSGGGSRPMVWMPNAILQKAKSENIDLTKIDAKNAVKALGEFAPKPAKTMAISRIREFAEELFGQQYLGEINKLANRLENDPAFSNAFKKR